VQWWQAYLVQLRKNRLTYAALHGYRYCEVRTPLDFSRPFPWTKVKAMMLLLSFAETVVAMEADAIVRNKTIRVESILSLEQYNVSGKDVIYTSDFQQSHDADPDPKSSINTGVYIMRSSPWTKVNHSLPPPSEQPNQLWSKVFKLWYWVTRCRRADFLQENSFSTA